MIDTGTEAWHSERIGRVGSDLAGALRQLIDSLPTTHKSQQRLADALGVNKMMSHKLLTALDKKDPLATVHLMPGPEPLRRLVKSARRRGASATLVKKAEKAIHEFEHLIQKEAGDRGGLDAIISASVPDVRARYELAAKQTIYRGMRQVKGVWAEVSYHTLFLHPSDDGRFHDSVELWGYVGLRRVRPGADLKLGTRSLLSQTVNDEAAPRNLEGASAADFGGVVLHDFCSAPVELQVYTKGEQTIYMLDWKNAVGMSSTRDVVIGEYRHKSLRRGRAADDVRTKSGLLDTFSVPSRKHVSDVILHEEVYPEWEAKVRVLELGVLGYAEVNDESRDMDELKVVETVHPLGWGIDHFRAEEIPHYAELLRYACEKRDWDPAKFRAYRCSVEYPIVGSQLQYAFDVPIDPSMGGAAEQ